MNGRRRSILSLICLGIVLLATGAAAGCDGVGLPAPLRGSLDLTILHTGQVYGDILPCG